MSRGMGFRILAVRLCVGFLAYGRVQCKTFKDAVGAERLTASSKNTQHQPEGGKGIPLGFGV